MVSGEFGIPRKTAEALSSEEADQVTPHMCAIYYRLLAAPDSRSVGAGSLLIKAENEGGVLSPVWSVLVTHLRVPPETARRALDWMEEKGFVVVRTSANGREIRITLEDLYFPEKEP